MGLVIPLSAARVGAQGTAYTVIHQFYDSTAPYTGANPYSGLIQGADGNFYGTTASGGYNGLGAIFKLTPIHFSISAPASATTGSSLAVAVTALDSSNKKFTAYTDTVHFTSADAKAVLPADTTLTNGTRTFTVKYLTPGSQSVTVTDTVNTALTTTAGTTVSVAASKLVVTALAAATAGNPITITVTAMDAYGNVVTGYTGTISFTSTDTEADLPANTTLTGGTGSFQVTLGTAGPKTITATDTVTSTIKGTSAGIKVTL